MNDLVSPDAEAAKARRRERINALRACRPHERMFLHQLPKSRYAAYTAGEVLGMSSRTVCKMLQRPRVKRAMAVFLDEALEKIGVTHASLVADLVLIKDQCIKHLTNEPKAAAGAIAAIKELAELLRIAPAKRFELMTPNGQIAAPMFCISFEDGAPGEPGVEVSDDSSVQVSGSDALN